jgi:hypothetical protein
LQEKRSKARGGIVEMTTTADSRPRVRLPDVCFHAEPKASATTHTPRGVRLSRSAGRERLDLTKATSSDLFPPLFLRPTVFEIACRPRAGAKQLRSLGQIAPEVHNCDHQRIAEDNQRSKTWMIMLDYL